MSSPNDNAGRIHRQAFIVRNSISFAQAELIVSIGLYRGSVRLQLVDNSSALLYSAATSKKALDRRWVLGFRNLLLDNLAEHNVFSHNRQNVYGGSVNYEPSGHRTPRRSSPGSECIS